MNKDTIRQILLMGGCLEFGRLSITPLDRYYRYGNNNQWQVHCDDSRALFSEVFTSLNKAIDTFVSIGRDIDAFSYKEPNYRMQPVPAKGGNAVRRNSGSGVRKQKRQDSVDG